MLSTREQWDSIYRFVAWLDRENGRDQAEVHTRIMKLTEENGEVIEAYFGMLGINKRKGVTHTNDELCMELADVILSAAIALATVAERDPAEIVAEKLAVLADRARRGGVPSPR